MKLLTPSKWRELLASEKQAQTRKDKRDAYFNQPKTSYRVRYTGPQQFVAGQVNIHLVPLPGKNLHVHMTKEQIAKDVCPTCNRIHEVKTVHLWLDGNGSCLISQGVKDSIEQGFPGGLAAAELEVVGGTDQPPPLTVGRKTNRREVDQANERITQWSK